VVHLTECAHLEERVWHRILASNRHSIGRRPCRGAYTQRRWNGRRRSLATLEDAAHRTGLRWVDTGPVRGMLAEEDRYERQFKAALALFGEEMASNWPVTNAPRHETPPLTAARRCPGGALHEALAYFERNGAELWAEQARAELRATGEITSRDTTGSLRFLTPQELQVALTVAQGITTREASAVLFLSPNR
jgi:hypothetical protein